MGRVKKKIRGIIKLLYRGKSKPTSSQTLHWNAFPKTSARAAFRVPPGISVPEWESQPSGIRASQGRLGLLGATQVGTELTACLTSPACPNCPGPHPSNENKIYLDSTLHSQCNNLSKLHALYSRFNNTVSSDRDTPLCNRPYLCTQEFSW